jgi:hypothetical protein
MPDNTDDILQILQEQQGNQNIDQDLEQALMNMLLNPAEKTTKQIRIVEDPNNSVMSEVREKIIINDEGFPEKLEEEIINVATLDDGSPMNSYGICRCQGCSRLVSVENLSRCLCGKTSCVMCGRFDAKNGIWYCCFLHKIIGKLFGLLRLNFR